MEEHKLARAKSCFLMLAIGAGFSLIQTLLPESNSLLGGILSLVSAVLILIAIWRLRAVEDGYRSAFMVEVVNLIFIIAAAGVLRMVVFSGVSGLIRAVLFLSTAVPMVLAVVFQYFFCTATGRVMTSVGAAQEAMWSGWMWKIHAISAVFAVLAYVLLSLNVAVTLLATLANWLGLLVSVLQIIYYILCWRATPEQ